MSKPIPKDTRLAEGVDKELVESDEYQHWLVSDLIEMLQEYPQDARVWIWAGEDSDDDTLIIRPAEWISGLREGEVYIA